MTFKNFWVSAGIYYFVMFVIYGMTTYPIYPNHTVKMASEAIKMLHLILPILTLAYLFFLKKKSITATQIHTQLHWIIFGIFYVVFYLMQTFKGELKWH